MIRKIFDNPMNNVIVSLAFMALVCVDLGVAEMAAGEYGLFVGKFVATFVGIPVMFALLFAFNAAIVSHQEG